MVLEAHAHGYSTTASSAFARLGLMEVRSYLICGVQRTGSWMLCHALEDSGVAGIPAEYFHRGDEPFWSERLGTSNDGEFFAAILSQRTPNGVFEELILRYRADQPEW